MYQEFTTIGSSWRYYNIVFDRRMILWNIDQGLRTALIDLSIRLVKDEIIFFVSFFFFLSTLGVQCIMDMAHIQITEPNHSYPEHYRTQ